MKRFDYNNPTTIEEAASILKKENATLIAGGTDLIGALRDEILPTSPEKVVSMKNIEGLNYIREEEGKIKIGAMTTLDEIADSEIVKKNCSALGDAAYSVASPNIRSTATIGGNLCQDVRCWYYRYPNSIGKYVNCKRKEGNICYAMMGNNRYHSIFGGMKSGNTPCTNKCPGNTDIPGYFEKLRKNDVDGAAKIILKANPMPAITSRVCAHFCQEGCNRIQYDETMNVGSVERYVGDYILDNADKFMTAPKSENGKSVAIVGSGPAGLSAAFYLRQSGYKVTVFERMGKPGGCLAYAIPAYRLPKDIVEKYVKLLEGMGICFNLGMTVGEGDVSLENLQKSYNSVLLDTGTWKRPLIGISGEELTRFGLDFLVAVNKYMHDRPGANVVVVGGGNVAVDVAITAKRLGANKVTMVCLEPRDKMPAGKEEIDRVIESGCELLNGWGPKSIIKGNNGISGIEFKSCPKVFDESGRFAPVYDENVVTKVDADVVFMAIGQVADLDFLQGAFKVETERGRIKVTEGNSTNIPGIFAGGDVTTGPATVIKAVTTGKSVAKQINSYLGGAPLEVEMQEKEPSQTGFLRFNKDYSNMVKYHRPEELPQEEKSIDKEDIKGMDFDKVYAEVQRCLNCGCVAVNPSDMANMLIALDAVIHTNMRSMSAEEMFSNGLKISDVLKKGEILLEIDVPKSKEGTITKYEKFRLRDSIDFAIAAVAWVCTVEDGKIIDNRLVLGAAAPIPLRAKEAEAFLNGKVPDEKIAEEAAEIAMKNALALPNNEYKIDLFKAFIKRTIANSF